MPLKFGTFEIPGHHGPIVHGSPRLAARRFKLFGILGEGEILGKPAGRPLFVQVLLHDRYDTVDKLLKFLDDLEKKIGENAALEEYGTPALPSVPRTLPHCTFEGWQPAVEEGAESGPLFDLAGTLDVDDDDAPVYGWWQLIVLSFYQLRKN